MIRAAIFDRPGQPFRFECFSRPKLAPGEALVRISLCTICGSDLHTFAGRRTGPSPCVLGHEPVGIIEELTGELFDVAGERLRAGDRVVWSVIVSCGQCFFCKHGLPQKCASLRKYGHERVVPDQGLLGGMATHCHLLRGTAFMKVPSGLPDRIAAPAGCATATVAAAWRVALRSIGQGLSAANPLTVVVIGLGMLGLSACAWATVNGHRAIACDRDDTRLSLAIRFGAMLATKPDTLVEQVLATTAGRGADLVLELSGSAAATRSSLEVLRMGGTAVWVGTVSPTEPVSVLPEEIVRRCLTITGIHNYAPSDLASAIAFLMDHHSRFPFAELVSHTFPLDSATAAFEFAESAHPIRVAIGGE
jgi:putative phosphonate catabolism associated alcohol dehydrogenase